MSEPKIVKVGRVGDTVQEVTVTDEMTVEECLKIADYTADGYEVYGEKRDGTRQKVQSDEAVNGFVSLALVLKLKGGQ